MKIDKYEIARVLDVSPQAVYKWFNGKNKPSVANLVKLSKYLGLTIDKTLELFK